MDFVPTPQLPTGLAEETVRLAAQRGQYNPGVAAAQALAQGVSGFAQGRGQFVQNREANALKAIETGRFQPKTDPETGEPLQIPKGVHLTSQNFGQFFEPVPQTFVDPTTGQVVATAPHGAKALPKPNAQSGQKTTDEENRKVVTDYAAKNGVSLDALRPGGMGGWNSANLAMVADMIKSHPEYDMQKLKLEFAGKQKETVASAGAPYTEGMVKIRNLSKSLIPQLSMMSQASDAVGRGDIKLINSIKGKVGVEFSDKDWSKLKQRAQVVADEFQAQIGAGSDKKLDLAKSVLDTADSPTVLKSGIDILKEAVKSRGISTMGITPTPEMIQAPDTEYDNILSGKWKASKGGEFDDLYKQVGIDVTK